MVQNQLVANIRKVTGKSANNKLRQAGKIPATLYGQRGNVLLEMSEESTRHVLEKMSGMHELVPISVNDSSNNENNRNIDYYLGFSISDISLILNKHKDFKNVKINKINVSSNSKRVLSLKSNNLQNIDKFLLDYFPKNENKNIVLDKNDFKKNSLYPYSEIPDLLDPFDENILNEINLLKNLLHYIFSNSLSVDRRNLFWFTSGLELYYLNKFIEEYHPDLLLIGKFSNLFFIKKHNLSKTKFTNQFRLGYNFVSARNLNQKLLLPSNELTRINYRLSSPAKSFYSLKILHSYVGEKHFKESILQIINSEKPIAQTIQIQNIFESISSKNLKWFFSDYLNYDGLIDLKVFKKKENFAIKNIKLAFSIVQM